MNEILLTLNINNNKIDRFKRDFPKSLVNINLMKYT